MLCSEARWLLSKDFGLLFTTIFTLAETIGGEGEEGTREGPGARASEQQRAREGSRKTADQRAGAADRKSQGKRASGKRTREGEGKGKRALARNER